MDAEVSTHTFLTMIILRNLSVSCRVNQFFFAIILMGYTRNKSLLFFINWTLRMSDNLPKRVQILGHTHILCITVWENRIICCQIFCDLLLKSAFEQIFNVMQLILVKIKWHIKWKYLIQKFHDICLSYYYKPVVSDHLSYMTLFQSFLVRSHITDLIGLISLLTVFVLIVSPTCPKAKFRKIFYLFKQIFSLISLVRTHFSCPGLRARGLARRLYLHGQ